MSGSARAVRRLGNRLALACALSFVLFLLLAESLHRMAMQVLWYLHALTLP